MDRNKQQVARLLMETVRDNRYTGEPFIVDSRITTQLDGNVSFLVKDVEAEEVYRIIVAAHQRDEEMK